MKYYLIFDNCCQWFTYAIKVDPNKQPIHLRGTYVCEAKDLTFEPASETLKEIVGREFHFSNREFQGSQIMFSSYVGWTITGKEYNSF